MDLITIPAYHTSNSYGTLVQADSYFTSYNRLGSSVTWYELSENQKKYALMVAARVLNTFKLRGRPVTKQQNLAFPRFTTDQIANEGKDSLNTFYDIDYTKIVDAADLTVTGNKFIDESTSADIFYNNLTDGDLQLDQLLKVVRSGAEYVTVTDIDSDGAWIEVKEDIESESDSTTTIYASDIFGFPNEVMWAQFELAYQVVDTRLFQGTVGQDTEYPIASFSIAGAMHVKYASQLFNANPFESSNPIDIVHYLLGKWLAGVKGRVV